MGRLQDPPHRRRNGHSSDSCYPFDLGSPSARIDDPRNPGDHAMTTLLTGRRLITADATVDYPRIEILGDGTIARIESGERTAEDTTLTAAFFDVHVHGAAG